MNYRDKYLLRSKKRHFPSEKNVHVSKQLSENRGTNRLYSELLPLVTFSRCLLLLPVSVSATGRFSFKWLSWQLLVSLIGWIILTINSTLIFYYELQTFERASERKLPLSTLIDIASAFVLLSHIPLIPLSIWSEANSWCSFFNEWSTVEDGFLALTGSPVHLGVRPLAWTVILAALGCAWTINILFLAMTPYASVWGSFPFLHFWMFILSVEGLWAGVCCAVRAGAQALADRLAVDGHHRMALRANRLLWIRLNRLLEKLSSGLVRTQQIVLLSVFVVWVTASFGLLNFILVGKFENFVGQLFHLMIVCTCGSCLYFICDSSESAANAIKILSRDELLQLPIQAMMNKEVATEVEIFLDTIRQKAVESLSVGGYIQVNRSTVITLLKTTGTYLVVLSQFALAYHESYSMQNQ